METALDNYVIKGVTHNIPLLRDVISHPRFIAGKLSTKFLTEEYSGGFKGRKLSETDKKHLYSVVALAFSRRDLRNRTWIEGGGSTGASAASEKTEWELYIGVGEEVVPVKVQRVAGSSIASEIEWKGENLSSMLNGNWNIL